MRRNLTFARFVMRYFALFAILTGLVNLGFGALEHGPRRMFDYFEPALYLAEVALFFVLAVILGTFRFFLLRSARKRQARYLSQWRQEPRASGMKAFEIGNYKTAFLALLPFAADGDPEAQARIGSMYHVGLGRISDEDEAVKWYTKASEQGNGLASNNLGTMAFMRGDREEAARWYEKARAQGFEHAPRSEWVLKNN